GKQLLQEGAEARLTAARRAAGILAAAGRLSMAAASRFALRSFAAAGRLALRSASARRLASAGGFVGATAAATTTAAMAPQAIEQAGIRARSAATQGDHRHS